MKNYLTLPFLTQDEWTKEVLENIAPLTRASTADTGLSPIYDDITNSATNDMLQAVAVQGKSPEEAIKYPGAVGARPRAALTVQRVRQRQTRAAFSLEKPGGCTDILQQQWREMVPRATMNRQIMLSWSPSAGTATTFQIEEVESMRPFTISR